MSLGKLLASIRERRRRPVQQPYEEGAQLRKRLQELLAAPSPTQANPAPPTLVKATRQATATDVSIARRAS